MGVDEAIAEIVTRFNADFDSELASRGCALRFVSRDAGRWGTAMWVVEDAKEREVATADAEALVPDALEVHVSMIADRIQEGLMGWLDDRAWPKCPDHEHPLIPDLFGAKAVWRCPATEGRRWAIGELGDALSAASA